MERRLKERLVGAGVLVLVVVLVLPELLSGRRDSATPESSRDEEGVPLRAHEFVMGDVPTAEQQAIEQDTLQPEPEPVAPAPDGIAEESLPAPTPTPTPTPILTPAAAPVVTPPPPSQAAALPAAKPVPTQAAAVPAAAAPTKPASAPASKPEAAPQAKPAAPQYLGAWVVQIGSFGTAQKAEQLVADLKSRGFRAFTLPYTANGRTLHRVRVGPEQNRKVADDIARRLTELGYTPHVAPQE